MKSMMKKALSLLLVLLIVFSGFVPALDAIQPVFATTKFEKMTGKQFQNYKPEILKVELTDYTFNSIWNDYHATYTITFSDTLKYEYEEEMVSVKITDKNGKHGSEYDYVKVEGNKAIISFIYAYSQFADGEDVYVQLRIGSASYRYKDVEEDEMYLYSKYSDRVKLPYYNPFPPVLNCREIKDGKISIDFPTISYYTRQLQIREKGSKTWAYVSKSKAVTSYRLNKTGYVLTLNTDKTYEFRARYSETIGGKKYYGKYTYADSANFAVLEAPPQVGTLTPLQFDTQKSGGIALIWDSSYDDNWNDDGVRSGYYQLAYRKAGSKDAWKTTKLKESEVKSCSNGKNYEFLEATTQNVKIGYEYRIRYCKTYRGETIVGKYSPKVTVTAKSSKFVNQPSDDAFYGYVLNNDKTQKIERVTYDPNAESNSRRLESFWNKYFHISFGSRIFVSVNQILFGENPEGPFHTVKVHLQKEKKEGLVGVEVIGLAKFGSTIVVLDEVLRFYTGDAKLANAIANWTLASANFGHANTDYFGFKDVEITDDHWILDYNGKQIEVTKGQKGYIFWFDMTK